MAEVISKRTRSSKTHSLGGRKFAWDGTIGSIHYEDNGWQNIDNEFLPIPAPWDWEMLKADYHIRVKEDFTAGQIIEFEVQGETVQFQPMALEWSNDLGQIQQVSMPQNITPVVTNPEVDLLPGMPSHQGTIRWDDAYGQGIDFRWKCTPTRLVKILEVENLNNLPVPQQYIIDGGNPVLRLNLIFAPSSGTDIYVDGEVWDKKAKKQTFNMIEFRKDGEVLWGFLPLRYWDSSEDNEGQSVATLEKRGNKFYISIRVPLSWLQSATYPVFIDTDIVPQPAQVGSSTDDVRVRDNGWSSGAPVFDAIDLTSTSHTIGAYVGNYIYGIGDRFTGITIAQADTIDVAYMTYTARASDSGGVVKARISAQVDDAATFSTIGDYNGRSRTSDVAWPNLGNWTNNAEYNSPSIVTPIQTVINGGSWASGQDIAVFTETDPTSDNLTFRVPYSYDQDSAKGDKLHIEYTGGAPAEAAELGAFYQKRGLFSPNILTCGQVRAG